MAEKFPVTFDEQKYPIGYVRTPDGTVIVHKGFLGSDPVTTIRGYYLEDMPFDDLGHRVMGVVSVKDCSEKIKDYVAERVGKRYRDPPYFM